MVYYSSPHGVPAPDDSDPVAAYASITRQLADFVDDLVLGGPVTTSTTGIVMSANWTTPVVRLRQLLNGAYAYVDISATRAAGAAVLTAGASGNIVDTPILVLPAAWRPARRQYITGNRSSLAQWQGFIHSDGELNVSAGYPNAAISPADVLQFQAFIELG